MWASREVGKVHTRGEGISGQHSSAHLRCIMDWLAILATISGLSEHQKKWVQPKKLQKSSPSCAGETGQPSINVHTNKYQYARQSLTKAKPLRWQYKML